MLMIGAQITQPGDLLRNISAEQLYQSIYKPKQEYQDLMHQLRMIHTLDKNQYAQLKKKLPYFVCGSFHPPYRKKENFVSISHMLLDLDHISATGKNIDSLFTRLKSDAEIMMLFRSPSGDGLKVMFKLHEDCRDSGLFSHFYKIFAMKFAEKYDIKEIVDFQTHDVTRACFLSFDPDAYYNELSIPLVIEEYIDKLDFDLAQPIIHETETKIKEQTKAIVNTPGIDNEILLAIRQKLNPGLAPRPKEFVVPVQIDKAIPLIQNELEKYNMAIVEQTPISYGNKLKIRAGNLWAEVNIFYGARGFSVVKTTKTGSNLQLAELAQEAIAGIISELYIEI